MLYLKWITQKDILGTLLSYVAAWMGKEFGGEWIHAYVWPNPFMSTTLLICYESRVIVTQSCPPDSSVHGILQARILEWVAFPFSKGFS